MDEQTGATVAGRYRAAKTAVGNAVRIWLIRHGWKRCDHRGAYHRTWRANDGTLMSHFEYETCGFYDRGHIIE